MIKSFCSDEKKGKHFSYLGFLSLDFNVCMMMRWPCLDEMLSTQLTVEKPESLKLKKIENSIFFKTFSEMINLACFSSIWNQNLNLAWKTDGIPNLSLYLISAASISVLNFTICSILFKLFFVLNFQIRLRCMTVLVCMKFAKC